MERNKYNPDAKGSGIGWLALGVAVTAYDVLAKETLSNGFRRGLENDNPLVKAGVYAGLGITALHLLDITPERIDPIDNFANRLGNLGDRIMEWNTRGIHIP